MKAIMTMLGQFLRKPVVISAFISVVLIMGGACVWWLGWGWSEWGSHDQPWHPGRAEWNTLIIDTDSAALPPLESPNGLGLYPDIPSDYPHQNIWAALERGQLMPDKWFALSIGLGYGDRWRTLVPGKTSLSLLNHELVHRVLIQLWKQGVQVDNGLFDRYTGKVYPLYRDTVYVWWLQLANPDGSIERDLVGLLCDPDLKDYHAAIEGGTQPSWLKVVPYDEGGINPYSFLELAKVSF